MAMINTGVPTSMRGPLRRKPGTSPYGVSDEPFDLMNPPDPRAGADRQAMLDILDRETGGAGIPNQYADQMALPTRTGGAQAKTSGAGGGAGIQQYGGGGIWNPQAPKLDPTTGQYRTPSAGTATQFSENAAAGDTEPDEDADDAGVPEAGEGRRGWNGLRLDMGTPKSTAAFEGFNEARASAGEDDNSIKDGFYRFMKASDFDPRGLSKDEAEAWMRSNLDAAADYGLNIVDVAGDKILVEVAEDPGNPHWVDWIRNSGGGDDQAVVWQDQSAEPG